MRVFDVTDVSKVYGVYDKQAVAGRPASRVAPSPKSDKLMLSGGARDFQAVMRGLKDVPEVRAEKVSEFGARYEAGTYAVDSRDVAEQLFRSGLFARKLL